MRPFHVLQRTGLFWAAAMSKAIALSAALVLLGPPGAAQPLAPQAAWSAPPVPERVGLTASLAASYEDLGDDRVVTAGLGVKTATISSFILRSYEAESGELISENEFDLTVDEGTAEAIAAGGGRVYAVGSGLTAAGKLSLLVRAYDAVSGELLWEDELNPAVNPRYQTGWPPGSAPGAVARAWQAAGQPPRPLSHSSFTVRAVHKRSGQVLWQDVFLASTQHPAPHAAPPAKGEQESSERDFSLVVRTYSDTTGGLIWEDQFRPPHAGSRTREGGDGADAPAPRDPRVTPDLHVLAAGQAAGRSRPGQPRGRRQARLGLLRPA